MSTEVTPKIDVAKTMFVLDSTATPSSGDRTHEMIVSGVVKPYTFKFGKPLELPCAIAVKFLRTSAFMLVDSDGNQLEYKRKPKQPDEMGAGEKFSLADDETVARFDELSAYALYIRAAELPGGEAFTIRSSSEDVIAFLKAHRKKMAKANSAKPDDHEADHFIPDEEVAA